MREIVLNELSWAERKISEPELGDHPFDTLSRVAKYYFSKGYGRRDIEKLLGEYVLRAQSDASLFRWADRIESATGNALSHPPVTIEAIPITHSEAEIIRSTSSAPLSRVLFTLFCLAKMAYMLNPDTDGWVTKPYSDIFLLANTKRSASDQEAIFRNLRAGGYISFSKKVDNLSLKVEGLCPDGDVAIEVTDMRNLGHQWARYEDERIRGAESAKRYMECAVCGVVVPKASNSMKYCRDCSRLRRARRQKEIYESVKSTCAE